MIHHSDDAELGRHKIEPIVMGDESTVVATYEDDQPHGHEYQSEAQLENAFIKQLQAQAYEYVTIRQESDLVANLRTQLERLNHVTFSDSEWKQFFETSIASANDGPAEKTYRLHNDNTQLLHRDDGTTKNIRLLDKTNIHNNHVQVINQYEVPAGQEGARTRHANRYDVTVLVNGLPLVQIELKRRGVALREAFNQIARYHRQSYWSQHGLFDYVQVFVISNGTLTKYYSNTTRPKASDRNKRNVNSFAFTSWWTDGNNKVIADLGGFTKTFFAKHSLLNILTKYCVLREDGTLLVMRPYQIAATERTLQRIELASNNRWLGTTKAGGYIWHTTGSGKTLTSFKTAQLATGLPSVHKVLFVVDRKDLDYQTMKEYDSFKKGAANSNTSTRVLTEQMGDPSARIIITTIQKLSNFVNANPKHDVYNEHIVLIFDECHRSQFGDMHRAITKRFKKYNIFGFTGTPIFDVNAGTSYSSRDGQLVLRTTEETFGDKLHTYTIVDAIENKNVLPFRLAYLNTLSAKKDIESKEVSGIDAERALLDPHRIASITQYILDNFNQHTKRTTQTAGSSSSFDHKVIANVQEAARARNSSNVTRTEKRRVNGFNALLATASVEAAKTYYTAFKKQQEQLPEAQRLKVATIFSYGANEDAEAGILEEEGFETGRLGSDSQEFLSGAIDDYNQMFGTSYSIAGDQFQNYYKDLSMRLKNRELDLAIVVNMFLTGFDAPTLNTLFVDKNLRYHGLIQAYSRTNRILNSVKTYGNIVSFRDLQKNTNDALGLFGNKDARGIVLLKPYEYYFEKYSTVVNELFEIYSVGTGIPASEKDQKRFVELFSSILRLQNLLSAFDEFAEDELIGSREMQDLQSVYLEIRDELRNTEQQDLEVINDDLVFEVELIKQVEVNVDYILMLVEESRIHERDREEAHADIMRLVNSSPSLRDKRDLIEDFVASVSADQTVEDQWLAFIQKRRQEELDAIIAEENLKREATYRFVENALEAGEVSRIGTDVTRILPRMSKFGFGGGERRADVKERVLDKLTAFVNRYKDLGR